MRSDLVDMAVVLHHETAKAWLVSETGEQEKAVWILKSQAEIEPAGKGVHILTLSSRLATDKGLVAEWSEPVAAEPTAMPPRDRGASNDVPIVAEKAWGEFDPEDGLLRTVPEAVMAEFERAARNHADLWTSGNEAARQSFQVAVSKAWIGGVQSAGCVLSCKPDAPAGGEVGEYRHVLCEICQKPIPDSDPGADDEQGMIAHEVCADLAKIQRVPDTLEWFAQQITAWAGHPDDLKLTTTDGKGTFATYGFTLGDLRATLRRAAPRDGGTVEGGPLRITVDVHSPEQTSCHIAVPKGMTFGEALARVQTAQTAIATEIEQQARCPIHRGRLATEHGDR